MSEAEQPFWGYQDLAVFVCLAIPCFLLGLGIVRTVVATAPMLHTGKALELLLGQFLGYALWFACLAFLLRTRYDRPLWPAMNWKLSASDFLPALSLGVLLALVVAVVGILLRTPQTESTLLELMTDRVSIIAVALFATTLGPLCEELAFRGFMLPLLVRTLGTAAGIVMTALPFALLHGPQYHWSWQHMILLSAAGCTFGWARHKTGSTGIPTVIHAGYNATFMAGFIFSKGEYF
ncbi:MAG: type II CAAX endopeptidase family protein [Bryobacteraceae bacterium]